jgi:hypothetical protein
VDEVNLDRFFEMSLVEFLEAFGRLAEKANMQWVGFAGVMSTEAREA